MLPHRAFIENSKEGRRLYVRLKIALLCGAFSTSMCVDTFNTHFSFSWKSKEEGKGRARKGIAEKGDRERAATHGEWDDENRDGEGCAAYLPCKNADARSNTQRWNAATTRMYRDDSMTPELFY
jgi:hypothetical protein